MNSAIEARLRVARAKWNGDYTYTAPSVVVPGRIWVGSMSDAANIEWLNAHKITHVVNCGQALYKYKERIVNQTMIQDVLVVNADDCADYPILSHLPQVVEFCDKAGPDARILFHCMAGVNRSPALVLAYATLRSPTIGSGVERLLAVFEALMAVRPIILENDTYYHQLLNWARWPQRGQNTHRLFNFL
jgi:predicted protein tyrosine phosphatase